MGLRAASPSCAAAAPASSAAAAGAEQRRRPRRRPGLGPPPLALLLLLLLSLGLLHAGTGGTLARGGWEPPLGWGRGLGSPIPPPPGGRRRWPGRERPPQLLTRTVAGLAARRRNTSADRAARPGHTGAASRPASRPPSPPSPPSARTVDGSLLPHTLIKDVARGRGAALPRQTFRMPYCSLHGCFTESQAGIRFPPPPPPPSPPRLGRRGAWLLLLPWSWGWRRGEEMAPDGKIILPV